MKGRILLIAAALVLSAGQATADGSLSKGRIKGAASAVPNWNGLYVGVGIGAGALDHDFVPSDGVSLAGDSGGAFGTVTIGYDRVIRPGWVAGVFADYDFSNVSANLSAPEFPPDFRLSVDHTHSWSVGARLGFLADPSMLLYGTVGYTRAEFDFSSIPPDLAQPLSSPRLDGYFVGAGVETFLRQSWTLKLEYRFTQFADATVFNDGEGGIVDLDTSMHSARLVLSYKFGHRD